MKVIKYLKKIEASKYLDQITSSLSYSILFSGSRYSCIDEFTIIEVENKFVAIASFAPNGEQNSGIPTIVGVWVLPEYRLQGLGREVLINAINRAISQGFKNIRIEAINPAIIKICSNLKEVECIDLCLPPFLLD